MQLKVYENQHSIILNFEQYCGVYRCVHCNNFWNQNCDYYRHSKSCTTTVRETFPENIHKNLTKNFKKLQKSKNCCEHYDCHSPFFGCYDFEAYFSKKQISSNSSMLALDACHVLLSVAVAINILGYESGVCLVTEGSASS